MIPIKKAFITILLTILASSAYAGYVVSTGYSSSCNQLVWVGSKQYDDGTWVPGHYVTVNNCSYPGYLYYGNGYARDGWSHDGGWARGGGGWSHGGGGFHGGGGGGHHH